MPTLSRIIILIMNIIYNRFDRRLFSMGQYIIIYCSGRQQLVSQQEDSACMQPSGLKREVKLLWIIKLQVLFSEGDHMIPLVHENVSIKTMRVGVRPEHKEHELSILKRFYLYASFIIGC